MLRMEIFLIIALGIPIFFLPTIVAAKRGHNNTVPIFLVNLLLGAVYGIGWVIALIWACTKDVKRQDAGQPQTASEDSGRLIICGGCGKQISFLATACPGCGHPRTEEEIAEAKMKEAAAREEKAAKEAHAKLCPKCGKEVEVNGTFCLACKTHFCPECRTIMDNFASSCSNCGWGKRG